MKNFNIIDFLTANLAWQESEPLICDLKELIKKEPWFKLIESGTTKRENNEEISSRDRKEN